MTIHEAGRQLLFELFHLYDEREAANIMDWVMENITGWKKIDRVTNKTVPLSAAQEELLRQYTTELQTHKPVQYVLQEAWFYKMKLYVDENVLIPRPETEELAEWLLSEITSSGFRVPGSQFAGSILDIGTGSGCIALALKKNLPAAEVYACDISKAALAVAKRNADDQQLRLQFQLLDILSKEERKQLPEFDIIISNPPYIPIRDKSKMSNNVIYHEPHLALFVENNDPLVFYRAIADFSIAHLKKSGSIYLEILETLANEVIQLYREKGFSKIELKKDLQGKDRMLHVS
jgi:release factor glutamine methyltransferase